MAGGADNEVALAVENRSEKLVAVVQFLFKSFPPADLPRHGPVPPDDDQKHHPHSCRDGNHPEENLAYICTNFEFYGDPTVKNLVFLFFRNTLNHLIHDRHEHWILFADGKRGIARFLQLLRHFQVEPVPFTDGVSHGGDCIDEAVKLPAGDLVQPF